MAWIIAGTFLIVGIPVLLVKLMVIDAENLTYIPPLIFIFLGIALAGKAWRRWYRNSMRGSKKEQ